MAASSLMTFTTWQFCNQQCLWFEVRSVRLMDRLVQTPVILLQVLEHVGLLTLLHVHLINKSIHGLIIAYRKSVYSNFAWRHYHDLLSERPSQEHQVCSVMQLAKLGRQQLVRDLADLLAKERKMLNEPRRLPPLPHPISTHIVKKEMRELIESQWGVVWRAQDVDHGTRHPNGSWTFGRFSSLQPRDTASIRGREVDYMCTGLDYVQGAHEGIRRHEAIPLDVFGLALLDEVLDRLRRIHFWHEPGDMDQ